MKTTDKENIDLEGRDIYKVILDQIQRKFENDDKSRLYLEQKLAILIAQITIFIGFLVIEFRSFYILPIIFAFSALISYVLGIWPISINDTPNGDQLIEIISKIKDNYNYKANHAYQMFVKPSDIKTLLDNFNENEKTNENKRKSIRVGIILNLISLIYWIFLSILDYYLKVKCFY